MLRVASVVFPGIPHHITQRGNRRESVFFPEEERLAYLGWLREYGEKHNVQVLAYCLMTNHTHPVLTPRTQEGLHGVLKPWESSKNYFPLLLALSSVFCVAATVT